VKSMCFFVKINGLKQCETTHYVDFDSLSEIYVLFF